MQDILDSLKTRSNLASNLQALNELIRQDESLRKQTPDCFYSTLNEILNEHLERDDATEIVELALKCLKNSSAALKTNLMSADETHICRLLLEYLNKNLLSAELSDEQQEQSVLIFIMQYCFNLSQGNLILFF